MPGTVVSPGVLLRSAALCRYCEPMRSLNQMFFSPTHPVGATGNVIVCGSLATRRS